MKTSSIEDFVKALYLLDEKLEKSGNTGIEIRAIGGFAMMYYGLRENGYTLDIDSLTADYKSPVKKIIREVGDELLPRIHKLLLYRFLLRGWHVFFRDISFYISCAVLLQIFLPDLP